MQKCAAATAATASRTGLLQWLVLVALLWCWRASMGRLALVLALVGLVGAWQVGWLASGARARSVADLVALTAALATRPWRLLASRKPLVHESHGAASPLWTPLLATLVFLPWHAVKNLWLISAGASLS